MYSRIIQIAVIGAGAVANEHHIPAWRRIPGTTITAICDANPQLAERTAHRWGVARYYTNLTELLKSEQPALVDICAPPNTHLSLIDQALAAGCATVIEKPIAMTLEESQKIFDLYLAHKDKGVKLAVIYNWMFQPQFQAMVQKIQSGLIGDILNVEIKCLHPNNEAMISNPNHWCHSIPGGRLGEVLIHPIYLLYRLIGNLQISEIELAKRGPHSWVRYDELSATFKAERGFGNIYISFNSPKSEFPIIAVYGTKGQMIFNGHNMNLIISTPRNSSSILNRGVGSLIYAGQIYRSLISNTIKTITGAHKPNHEVFFRLFTNYINGKGNPPLTFEEAFRINAIYVNLLDYISDLPKSS
jgi:predicted dehydrogenase